VTFEWDEAKGRRNARRRGLPFELAEALFASATVEWEDTRRDYGERRFIAVGRIGNRFLLCVYTWRHLEAEPIRRVISLRPAKRREIDVYRQAYPEAD
jgi:uncharacterized protein